MGGGREGAGTAEVSGINLGILAIVKKFKRKFAKLTTHPAKDNSESVPGHWLGLWMVLCVEPGCKQKPTCARISPGNYLLRSAINNVCN